MADGKGVPAAAVADHEELEPLFDYSRVQPTIDFRFDDADLELSDIFVHCNKRSKLADAVATDALEKGEAGVQKVAVVNLDDEDWLAPPPLKPMARADVCKDKTLREPRLQKQEVARLAEDRFEKVVETVKKDLAAKKPAESIVLDDPDEPQMIKPTEPHVKKPREKILITIQGIDGKLPFRVSKDEKFDKLFNVYAKKVQVSPSDLTFVFDGDKINSGSTPRDLDLEDDDLIEVRRKSS